MFSNLLIVKQHGAITNKASFSFRSSRSSASVLQPLLEERCYGNLSEGGRVFVVSLFYEEVAV